MRDASAFRERFKQWKTTGELPYEAGLPKYKVGKDPDEDLINSLIKYEGFLETPKDIGDGKITIGSGLTNRKYTSKGHITRAENRAAVKSEVNQRRSRLSRTIPGWSDLPDSAKNALIHYDYNFPITDKSSPKLLKYLAAKDWKNAASQMDAGINMKGFSRGLRNRRQYEQQWFLSDLLNQTTQNTAPNTPSLVQDVLPSRPEFSMPWTYTKPTDFQYQLDSTVPESISSWSSGDGPAPKTRNFSLVSDLYNLQRQLSEIGQSVTLNQPQRWIVQ